ncbi:DUF3489 domain-containing protein [Caballeronia sp. TF1N1]|uniref:DUF3489 domain-containing protein n=1 Tax=Caballeronia sp. TF1N1 TaxID=2878153 RepID=UPI001FD1251B|nr:DUF3489 domain-containing protein [Caballeronia sp. TF1N1]
MATKATTSAAKKSTTKATAKTATQAAVKKAAKAPAKAARTSGTQAATKPRTTPAKSATKGAVKPTAKSTPASKQAPSARKTDPNEAFFASRSPASTTPAVSAVSAPATSPAPAPAPVSATAHQARASRQNTAQARVIAMLAAPEGVTLDAIMSTTGWQAHTVRGFISGTAKKKLGLTIESARVDGKRTYRVAA